MRAIIFFLFFIISCGNPINTNKGNDKISYITFEKNGFECVQCTIFSLTNNTIEIIINRKNIINDCDLGSYIYRNINIDEKIEIGNNYRVEYIGRMNLPQQCLTPLMDLEIVKNNNNLNFILNNDIYITNNGENNGENNEEI